MDKEFKKKLIDAVKYVMEYDIEDEEEKKSKNNNRGYSFISTANDSVNTSSVDDNWSEEDKKRFSQFIKKLREREEVKYSSNKLKEKKLLIELVEYLLHIYNNDSPFNLSPSEIERYLFDRENNAINSEILYVFRRLETDMAGVSFDGIYLKHMMFTGLKNVTINLDKIIDKDLRHCSFKEVNFIGSFDNCKLYFTRFEDCTSESRLDLQTVNDGLVTGVKFGNMKVFGSTDGMDIGYADFSNVDGDIYINPQKLVDKNLDTINFCNCFIVGDDKDSEPSFNGCRINHSSFKGSRNSVTININELRSPSSFNPTCKLDFVNLTGVTLIGDITLGGQDDVKAKDVLSDCSLEYNGKSYNYFNVEDPETYGNCPDIKINIHREKTPFLDQRVEVPVLGGKCTRSRKEIIQGWIKDHLL